MTDQSPIAPRSPDLTDDEITAYEDDPTTIPSHEIALEVIRVLDEEIAAITMQLERHDARYPEDIAPADRRTWALRATMARAFKRQARTKVMMRDRELRGIAKGPAQTPPDPDKALERERKHQRLMAEVEARKAAKLASAAENARRQAELSLQSQQLKHLKSYQHRFVELAKALLDPEDYEQLCQAASAAMQGEGGG